ncbi:hypothetical protein F4819DRAFT_140936 [Hypoxylon fuscum]|nr:hypothetical protein F4819DRAFT_140936 [Hypoxylon fuscum]
MDINQESYAFGIKNNRDKMVCWDIFSKAVVDDLDVDGVSLFSNHFLQISFTQYKDRPISYGLALRRTGRRGTFTQDRVFELEDVFNGHLHTLNTEDYLEIDSSGMYTINRCHLRRIHCWPRLLLNISY